MHPRKKSSAEFDKAEQKLEEIRNSFIKHLEEVKKDSTGLTEEHAPLLRAENEPTVESFRMTEIIGKSKQLWNEMEKPELSAAEEGLITGGIGSTSAQNRSETAESLLKEMRIIQVEIKDDIHYLALQQMIDNFDPDKEAQNEMKTIGVVVNHVTGIILGILNMALFIYTAVVMCS